MRLSELAGCLPFYERKGPVSDPVIASICHHHREVTEGALFIALKGENKNGNEFAEQAVKNGAVAVLTDTDLGLEIPQIIVRFPKHAAAQVANAYYGYPSFYMNMIGVTGTNGKTTVSHMLQSVFDQINQKTGIIGTLYMKQGDIEKTSVNTTPDSLLLQKTLYDFRMDGVKTVVVEASSHGLVQGRLYGCDFDIGVFTNLTQDHLDYHKTMEHYKWSKTLLFSQLGQQHVKGLPKFAVINADDPYAMDMIQATSAHIITYGMSADADVYATDVVTGHNETSFTIHTPYESFPVTIKFAGVFNVYNALAAAAAGFAKRVPGALIRQGLEELNGVPGRFELVQGRHPFTVIIDYAHTPDSLENVLRAIIKMKPKKIFTVVGCGGDRDRGKRPLMAKVACGYSNEVIFTSDNPRTEKAENIIRDMEKGVPGERYTSIIDRKIAIEHALSLANEGDVVLIAGKGHEKVQIIGTEKKEFDDKAIAEEILQTMV
ncbi:UDP-N-acetylmuramoyl-L-alanyl-D-glutamate--2,6-diaminopimelate ligase [Jeotgalibacillus sp. R-1-5s-1]|uniref:UDP-N-acetylmuramoyl-L-alanyl-D-glutamate--2, 6-diaminopimelate ligase n=1 Tax=Jeotgalibacillus sp. R-1-5s-1 TaxID=2555897 RepID=UPI001069C173|nr:UDP-N-acetylmuramoyl-L-alanyl-D-glutamate--2,6-diaminopimelate ligase [Jeotgalibacillus sp. R-1-5s-1]TFE03576.1 UDP-N-acetylmuramoyl-L-alanyl-D-glutamate--2,6-diaminopimelate ligase [Jeotgalibacillus sp. R-1-5s-1]